MLALFTSSLAFPMEDETLEFNPSYSAKAVWIFTLPPTQNICRMPLGIGDENPALPLSLPASRLPGSGVFRQESFSVMPRWVVGPGVLGPSVSTVVAIGEMDEFSM